MSVFRYINNLLHNNDCVILPDFGAFVLKSRPAYIEKDKFFPPSKYVSFNAMLKENDGLLIKHISKHKNISYNKSLNFVKEQVRLLNLSLNEDLILEIESLGIFELRENKNLIFNPDLSINFDSSNFGLQSFTRHQIAKSLDTKSKNESEFNISNLLRYAASALLLVGLSYFGFINYNDYVNNEKIKNIAITQNQILENIQRATFDLGELPEINLNVNPKIIEEDITYYSVIAGSFRSKINAKKHLNYLLSTGYQASFTSINPKGLYRVAYARLKSRGEAAKMILNIKNLGQDAWLLIEN